MDWNWGVWLMSPGFGGAAAVLAASLAFIAAARNRRSEDRRAREARWWEQVRWASDLVMKDGDDQQAMGVAALAQLAEEAPDVEAAQFAAVALESVIFEGDEIEMIDDSEEGPAEWEEQETEEH